MGPAAQRDLADGISATGYVDGTTLERSEPQGRFKALYAARSQVLRVWADRVTVPRALVAAMVLGERSGVDVATQGAFRRAGLSHVLAVSGTHAAIVAVIFGVAIGLLGGGARWRWIGALFALAAYAVVLSQYFARMGSTQEETAHSLFHLVSRITRDLTCRRWKGG